jgi:hypothetical protein
MRVLGVAAVLVSLVLARSAVAGTCSARSPAQTVALVELYTSQGCSSCPPADRWLAALPQRLGAERAIPLSLHVGYWDYIGWKDPFAQRAFNERQSALAQRNGGGAYTPEVFVGGAELPDWRSESSFARALDAVQARPAPFAIELVADLRESAVKVEVSVDGRSAASVEPKLVVVLKQHGHHTQVSAGENRGAQLANDHVVRHWSGPLAIAQARALAIALPDDGPRRFELGAFAQDPRSGAVLQAVALPLERCGP